MNFEVFDIIVFASGAVIGFAICFIFKNNLNKNTSSHSLSHNSETSIESLQQEMDRKHVATEDFFLEANETLKAAEKKLADLRGQLVSNAKSLTQLELSKSTLTQEHITSDTSPELAEPPKDYSTNFSHGTLSEGFGLKTDLQDEEPKRTI
jgi:uncharacterized protein